ncbi:efflux RND transporter periplasmic adaptor subunit [Fusibacter paucivorans]|uniref:Efflux RND transporter periplasmic adaptor subunit n=1 Tax=Fusibacter paucivorans TaxID=76009 RepID=A0ABS5PNY6_9FIRM|nr:efflux RND transporter periplasmic adaptor subunit [Fusibacter paucivorans]MBS7526884.1 efflux RND transporter periplasmic adaptor subunit [Fusibacter paucivorans]
MNNYHKIGVFFMIILTIMMLAGCGKDDALAVSNAAISVATQKTAIGTLAIDGTYIGTVSSENSANVIAQVSGVVEAVNVSVGESVTAGALLCQLDDSAVQHSLASSEAGYESAVAGYNTATAHYAPDDTDSSLENKVRLARQNTENMQALFQDGAVSQAQLDGAIDTQIEAEAALKSAKAGIETAQAAMQSAQAGVDSARYQISLYQLTAPISGVIDSINATVNNLMPSGTVAMTITDPDSRSVVFYVSDKVRAHLAEGNAVAVQYNGSEYMGTVSEVGMAVDMAAGLFRVKAFLQGAADLPNGATVELTTVTETAKDQILVPYDALYFENGAAYVYVVEDSKAVKRDVTVTLYDATTAAIQTGLTVDEVVITSWSSTLKDGVAVSADASQALEESDVMQ